MRLLFITILSLFLAVSAKATETSFTHESEKVLFAAQIETGFAWETPQIKNIVLQYKPSFISSLFFAKPETIDKSNIEKISLSEPRIEAAANEEFNSVRIIRIKTKSDKIKEIVLYINNDHPENSVLAVDSQWGSVFQGRLQTKNIEKKPTCDTQLRLISSKK